MEPQFYNQMPDTRVRILRSVADLQVGDECMVVAGRPASPCVELVPIVPAPAVNYGRQPSRGGGRRGYMINAARAPEFLEVIESDGSAGSVGVMPPPPATIQPNMPQTLVKLTTYDETNRDCADCGLNVGDQCYMQGRNDDDYPVEIYTAPGCPDVASGGGTEGAWVLSLADARRWFTVVDTSAAAAATDDPVLTELHARRVSAVEKKPLSKKEAMKAYWSSRSSREHLAAYLTPLASIQDPLEATNAASVWIAWLLREGVNVSPVSITAAQKKIMVDSVNAINNVWREITVDPVTPTPPPDIYAQLKDNY